MRRLFTRALAGIGLAALAAATGACGDSALQNLINSSTAPTATVTESFTGSLAKNGAMTFPFTASTAGTITATLTTVSPDTTATLGLSLGTWNGNLCQIILAKDSASQGNGITGASSTGGSLCVRIYDSTGTLSGTVTFAIEVIHPQ